MSGAHERVAWDVCSTRVDACMAGGRWRIPSAPVSPAALGSHLGGVRGATTVNSDGVSVRLPACQRHVATSLPPLTRTAAASCRRTRCRESSVARWR